MRALKAGLALIFAIVSAAYAQGCTDSGSADSGGGAGGQGPSLKEVPPAAATYEKLVFASYQDSLTAAQALDAAIASFLSAPSKEGLTEARKAWLAAREPYLQTEAYRFYDGPIDNAETGPEGLINAWPLDENYIDATVDSPDSGIINDPDQELSEAALIALNTQGGEANVATGFHAIEFLLWGQDLSDDGPGDRSYTDYTTAANASRRAEYLTLVSKLLVKHLTSLVAAWKPEGENYRSEFAAAGSEKQLTRILTGLIILSGFETGGERLQPALDSQDQEDEHSCFSDNTHRDFIQDILGVENVYLGRYLGLGEETSVEGEGVFDVVDAVDRKLALELKERIATSLSLAKALKIPFDREIAADNPEGNARVQALIDSLRAQEELLEEVFRLFSLDVPAAE